MTCTPRRGETTGASAPREGSPSGSTWATASGKIKTPRTALAAPRLPRDGVLREVYSQSRPAGSSRATTPPASGTSPTLEHPPPPRVSSSYSSPGFTMVFSELDHLMTSLNNFKMDGRSVDEPVGRNHLYIDHLITVIHLR